MPRRARLDAPGVLHHVTARGIARGDVFLDDDDRSDLLARIGDASRLDGLCVLAWALMSNHVHLLARSGEVGISRALQRVLGGYASRFNRRHRRCGHLFQNRFASTLVQDDPYLLELVRYIHLNPVRAELVPDLDALDVYPWTGDATLMGTAAVPWQEPDLVLASFGTRVTPAREAYRDFLADGRQAVDLLGGGVRECRGELKPVTLLARGRERWAFDERVLGSREFVHGACTIASLARSPRLPRGDMDRVVARILDEVAQTFGLSVAELCSGTKRRRVVAARALAGFLAVCEAGVGTATIAATLGVTPRALARVLADGARVAQQCRISDANGHTSPGIDRKGSSV